MIGLLYDLFMAPLEARVLGRWRRQTWSLVPAEGLGLELGAGTGANAGFYPPSASLIAIDRSIAMLARAKRKRPPPNVLFVVADVQALPFRQGLFDWAVATLVFCEVRHPAEAFGELGRVLGPRKPIVLLEHVRPGVVIGIVTDVLTWLIRPLWGEHLNRQTSDLLRASALVLCRQQWLWRDVVVLLSAHSRA